MHGETVVADYATFHARAAALAAAGLRPKGIKARRPGGAVHEELPDYLVALYGIWIAGRGGRADQRQAARAKEAAWIIGERRRQSGFVTPDAGGAGRRDWTCR
jgi:long-chain acyl-CoA synthetase